MGSAANRYFATKHLVASGIFFSFSLISGLIGIVLFFVSNNILIRELTYLVFTFCGVAFFMAVVSFFSYLVRK